LHLNYYAGREERALQPATGSHGLPLQPGLSVTPVSGGTLRGRTHIVDSFFTWQAAPKLLLAGEGDYFIARVRPDSPPGRVIGAAGWAEYRFTPRFRLAGRFTWLNDETGLYGGVPQSLKEVTLGFTRDVAPGFQLRWEYRRDASNVPYFLTRDPEVRKREQNTALFGLVWWFGGKQDAW